MVGFQVLAHTRDIVGESPLYVDEENALYWVDILGCKIHRLSLSDGGLKSLDVPEMIGFIAKAGPRQGIIAGLQSGVYAIDVDNNQNHKLCSLEPDQPGNRINDGKVDASGRLWVGTMPIEGNRDSGAIYCITSDLKVTCVDTGYQISNGLAFSPDNNFVYIADSPKRLVYRLAVHDDGTTSQKQVWINFKPEWGVPDGMTVDQQGCLWIAHWGGACLSRFDPAGVLVQSIPLPASQITSCTFAGKNHERLIVTSARLGDVDEALAGALFEVATDVRGFAPTPFSFATFKFN